MKRTITLMAFAMGFAAFTNVNAQKSEKCLTDIMFQEAAAKDPSLYLRRAEVEKQTEEYAAKAKHQKRASAAPKIIPVVFHVIHECGSENISREQILDQIRILNLDFRRKNKDTVRTPAHFDSLAADVNIEFRLATLDPLGNPTDGVVRVFSHLTNNARDNVKALSYWDSKKYLNIWVVKSINSTGALNGGIVLGFAQFPNSGNAKTDGVEIRADYIGSIGTSTGHEGRTATHEVGHWLNLRHIWGDAQCGSDLVNDTPTHFEANQSNCPTYPHVTNCATGTKTNNGPYGEMFMNYMDYVDDACMNMFSVGQSTRMNAVVSGTGFRTQLVSQANLVATGTDDAAVQKATIAHPFYCEDVKLICAGSSTNFSAKASNVVNEAPVTWKWEFPGGSPATSSAANPSVTYANPGTYDIKLVAITSAGKDSIVEKSAVIVSQPSAFYGMPFSDNFESPKGWSSYNNDNDNVSWKIDTINGKNGKTCWKLNNFNSGSGSVGMVDVLVTPSIDFSKTASPAISYDIAYATKSTSANDALKVYYSRDCGKTWTLRQNLTVAQMSSGGLTTDFKPSATQWKTINYNGLSALTGNANVIFKFEFTTGSAVAGNNLYIDNFSASGVTSIDNSLNPFSINLSIFPNPTQSSSTISFDLDKASDVQVKVFDLLGREVQTVVDAKLADGNHTLAIDNLSNGIYTVRITVDGASVTQKLIRN